MSRKSSQIFIRNLPWTVSHVELARHMSKYGDVLNSRVPFDKETGMHRGLGWISFRKREDMERCLQDDRQMLEGKKIYLRSTVASEMNRNQDLDTDQPWRGERNQGNFGASRNSTQKMFQELFSKMDGSNKKPE